MPLAAWSAAFVRGLSEEHGLDRSPGLKLLRKGTGMRSSSSGQVLNMDLGSRRWGSAAGMVQRDTNGAAEEDR